MKKAIVTYLTTGILLFSLSGTAQKLPNVQEKSLRAPAAIKIDGKATEWGDQFQAYNKATGIYYTISNDSNNLYLIVQARDQDNVAKIVEGGITFSINGQDKDKDIVAVTYPRRENKIRPFWDYNNEKDPDSLLNVKNKQIKEQFTTLKITGQSVPSDSILSIYNIEGIKTASLFNNKVHYTYELSLPIRYLNLQQGSTKFNYKIRLNGLINGNFVKIREDIIVYQIQGGSRMDAGLGYVTPEVKAMFYPTDFSGEYTLSK